MRWWQTADLDWLMATFGDVAVDPLSEVLSNIGMEEILRMYCATSLVSIAKNGHRSDEIWALFRELLRKRPLHRAVNGIMLSEMATHLGKEAAEFVLEIYDTNVVDVTHCGDRENLEVEMGIRKERDTPRPHLGELEAERKAAYFKQELGPLPEDASPEQILQYFLIVYERPRAAKDVAMLHGALSVLVASPQMAPPSAISTIVWDLRAGDPSQTPIWDGMEEAQLFMNALMVFYNQIASSLGTRGFGPYLRELEEGLGYDEPIDLEGPLFSLENWAEGISDAGDYLEKIQGPSEFTTALRELSDELLVETIKYPVMDSEQVGISSFEMVDFLGETRESQQGMLMNPQSSVMGFPEGLSSFDLPPTEQVIRDAPKIGRNDLCPCGSGKKYKRCCAN